MSTTRTTLMAALKARLQTITVANGYQTDLGLDVAYWRDPTVEHGRACVGFRDVRAEHTRQNAMHLHTVRVQIVAFVFGDDLGAAMDAAADDIIRAIGTDPTLGVGLAVAEIVESEWDIRGDAGEAGTVNIGIDIKYKVPAWNT